MNRSRGDSDNGASYNSASYTVAIPLTVDGNGIAEAIYAELEALGHRPFYFPLEEQIPEDTDVAFLFGPFGKFLHIPRQFAGRPRLRPTYVFWNTEGLPDLRIPWPVMGAAGLVRSWVGRLTVSPSPLARRLAQRPPLSTVDSRFVRFRYVGDYLYSLRRGWMDVFADISAVYADFYRKAGMPARVAPFGSFSGWYADLGLERDIDVLWMGKRATRRRSEALDRIRAELEGRGVNVYVVDNVERPFVFDEARTHLINRAKITLNLLRTWYDENSLRICLASPNRSLVVSEPLLPHVPQYQAGIHYAAAPLDKLADTVVYYLQNETERRRIVENAYRLMIDRLTFRNSMQTIMDAVAQARRLSPALPSARRLAPERGSD